MTRRLFLWLVTALGIAPAVGVTVPSKGHMVIRNYRIAGHRATCIQVYRPQDFHSSDLDLSTVDGERAPVVITTLLADGKPVREFEYWIGEQSFSRQECD